MFEAHMNAVSNLVSLAITLVVLCEKTIESIIIKQVIVIISSSKVEISDPA